MGVTAKEVARRAEVSVGTVSRVFNNYENVNEELKNRVLRVAKELGYSAQPVYSPIRAVTPENKLNEVGFLLTLDDEDSSIDPFWAKLLHGAETEAHKYGIKVTYSSVRNLRSNPQDFYKKLHEMHSGGILLVGPTDPELINFFQSTRTPFVLVDNYLPRQSIDAVLCDNFEGAREALDYLISLGHSQIAFIGGPLLPGGNRPVNKIYPIERRAAGYRTALLDAGLKLDYGLYESCNLTVEGGYEAAKRLLNNKSKFSALFCANDKTAIGAMKALKEAGRRLPEDVSVIGFDDIELAEHVSPSLTTLRINKESMGAVALDRLISRIKNPEGANMIITLEVELIKRDSVAPLQK